MLSNDISEYFVQQCGSAVNHCGKSQEPWRHVDKTDQFNHSFNVIERSNFTSQRQKALHNAKSCSLLSLWKIDIVPNLACDGEGAINLGGVATDISHRSVANDQLIQSTWLCQFSPRDRPAQNLLKPAVGRRVIKLHATQRGQLWT